MGRIKVLILGADGMLGRSVYFYLKARYSKSILGTSRRNSNFILFDALKKMKFKKIFEDADYVINCISVNEVSESNKSNAMKINSELPIFLDHLAIEYNFILIQVSSDAVFASNSREVTEVDIPNPENLYGQSKLQGEAKGKNSITFRTSIIGLNPIKKKGILEFVLSSQKEIEGYENVLWSGCDTLQFSKLCEQIIFKNKFYFFKKKSDIFHFCPLGPVSKYKLIKSFINAYRKNIKVKKIKSPKTVSRFLTSNFFDKKFLKTYTTNLSLALKKLIHFESSLRVK